MEGGQTQEGNMPVIEKFVELWVGKSEKNKRTTKILWMEVKRLLGEKALF